jgi:3-oxoacyl-[acyl-carrier protein] reductase
MPKQGTVALEAAALEAVALVTGGGTGVGRATSLLLAQRGFDVVVNYSRSAAEAERTASEVRALGRKAVAIQADVSSRDQVTAMAGQIKDQWGGLDVVVNNAATTHFIDLGHLDDVTAEVWDQILDVNLKGAFWVAQQMVPLMKNREAAAMVNVASMAGVTGAGSCLPYAASKGALMTMTKSLARGLAPHVRVNAVCPGVIESRWLQDHPEMIEGAMKVTPLGRPSRPEDVAQAIVYLACDALMMTGQMLQMDGGRTI